MPEVKNAFIKSKMNKDLDARLLPSGEYRHAINAQVSRSEGPDEGALENILGNISVVDFVPSVQDLSSIGFLTDEARGLIFVFLTDNDEDGYNDSGVGSNHYIYQYNVNNSTATLLVEGKFLNFSKLYPMTGINILEELLFFTDDRNQPRKINIESAAGGTYYTTEDQLSVAKYNPYLPMYLYKKNPLSTSAIQYETTMKDVVSEFLPDGTTNNPYRDLAYSGDSKFMENKFMRFSYRFKFDDGEYSIFAPFTQSCFIPKQDGYFFDEDQQEAFESSIITFMENKVNNIELIIPLPGAANSIESNFLIKEIDIISKESDGLAVNVIDTIPVSLISGLGSDEYYAYNYTNKKPYKTLPEKDLIRVYDKIPVRALSQEVASNRVIYGNFQTKHTPPASLDYNVAITEKAEFDLKIGTAQVNVAVAGSTTVNIDNVLAGFTPYVGAILSGPGITSTVIVTNYASPTLTLNTPVTLADDALLTFDPQGQVETSTSLVEYPSSSLKTNRQYQVGFVLSDRYGRQSGVILSNSTTSLTVGTEAYLGSTVYAPYITQAIAPDEWRGQSIKVLLNELIPTGGSELYPGLYNGDVNDPLYNPLGWYSYKIVVKQTEQEYYNVYTPGALKGDAAIGSTDGRETSYISLINDNINKVPRDLSEVGPQDKSFRSSVRLYGRVNNEDPDGTPRYSFTGSGNRQFYPAKNSFTVNNIQDLFDLFNYDNSTPPVTNSDNIFLFYNNNANPIVGEITTSFNSNLQFGTPANAVTPFITIENLAVFETEPVESKLDIFWETTSAGLISDLNSAVANASSSIVAFFSSFNTSPFNEGIAGGDDILAADFRIVDNFGADVTATIDSVSLVSVFNREGTPQNVASYFTLTNDGSNNYNVITTFGGADKFIENVYYGDTVGKREFDFTFEVQLTDGGTTSTTTIIKEALLANLSPTILASDGTSTPDGAVGNVSRDTSIILTVTGKNGGNSNHSGKDLTWTIISATNSSGSSVSHFSLITSNTNSLSTCKVINDLSQSQTRIPVDDYTIGLRLQDPGGASSNLTITVSFGNAITSVKRLEAIYEPNNYASFDIEFTELFFDEGVSATDGYYLYDGSWESLQQQEADATNTITVDNTNASKSSSNCTSNDWAYHSGVNGVRTIMENCEYNGNLYNFGYGTTIAQSEIDAYGFNIT